MRRSIYKLIKCLSSEIPFDEPIFEFGSLQVPGQENRSDLRPFFPGKEYVGCDFRPGRGVDRILDLHKIDLPDNSVGAIIMLDVLEHVKFLSPAMDELYRILKPGGVVIITSVMFFPVHDHPSDYWRFTPAGFAALLGAFPTSTIDSVGLPAFPSTIVALAFKGEVSVERATAFRECLIKWRTNIGNSWQEFFSILLPPIILVYLYPIYRKIEMMLKGHKGPVSIPKLRH